MNLVLALLALIGTGGTGGVIAGAVVNRRQSRATALKTETEAEKGSIEKRILVDSRYAALIDRLEDVVSRQDKEMLLLRERLATVEASLAATQALAAEHEAIAVRLDNMEQYASMGDYVEDGWLDLANEAAEREEGVRVAIITDDVDQQTALGHELKPAELLEAYERPTELQRRRRALARRRVAALVRAEAGLGPWPAPDPDDIINE